MVLITLTDAMIRNGYVDIPSEHKHLFPSDCFGSRAKGDSGAEIELRYGGRSVMTDIRVKSANNISPRKRFKAWFEGELGAAPGDIIRLTRVEPRTFELTYAPK